MAERAILRVTTGPDRGRSLQVAGDLVHIGREGGCDLVLSDPDAEEHQASLCHRNGRFALYAAAEGIEIDGTVIPVEQWVWLPNVAQIRLGRRTALQFAVENGSAATSPPGSAGPAPATDSPPAPAAAQPAAAAGTKGRAPSPSEARPGAAGTDSVADLPRMKQGKRAGKKPREVARFITDGPGDPLVKLGEDGHLPELHLDEGRARKDRAAPTKSSNTWLLVSALVASFGMSFLMLFLDAGQLQSVGQMQGDARREITDYYGHSDEALKPYQMRLREARQAHTRGDRRAEREQYRQILDLLRAEGNERTFSGVTGNRNGLSDTRLEQLISILMQN